MQRDYAILIKKNGRKYLRGFPVTLTPGDRLVVARDVGMVQAPLGSKWTVHGYQVSGNICSWDINEGSKGGKD